MPLDHGQLKQAVALLRKILTGVGGRTLQPGIFGTVDGAGRQHFADHLAQVEFPALIAALVYRDLLEAGDQVACLVEAT